MTRDSTAPQMRPKRSPARTERMCHPFPLFHLAALALAAFVVLHSARIGLPDGTLTRRRVEQPVPLVHRTRVSRALPVLPAYDRYSLSISSMWGMGSNARTIPPRRVNVPLVSWTAGAAARVQHAWQHVQRLAPCDRAMYAYTSYWGITSQMRDYGDAALIALAFRRPLVYIPHRSQPKWCQSNAWLGCFFQDLGKGEQSQRCRMAESKQKSLTFRPNTTSRAAAGFHSQRTATRDRFAEDRPILLPYATELNFVLDDPLFVPWWLWDDLLRHALVIIRDEHNNVLDPTELNANHRSLYHTLVVSALRTMLAPVLFRPNDDLQRRAESKARQLRVEMGEAATQTCVAVHVRWTDKAEDGGVANVSAYSIDYVAPALKSIRNNMLRGRRNQTCVLVLTDDDANAMPALARVLSSSLPGATLRPLSRVQDILQTHDDYLAYAKLGHRYVSDVLVARAPARAYAYFSELIVDILVASKLSRALIGVGSSGVSQLVAQYMGAHNRVDANALAVWKEDVLGI